MQSGIAAELAISRIERSIVSLEPPEVAGYDLASYYEPAREIGGDFFELFRLRRRGRPLGVVIADVTGKGIAAALLMAFARPVIHTALQAAPGPADALRRTNGSSSTSCTPPCSSPRWWVGWTSPADGSPSPVPVTNRRC